MFEERQREEELALAKKGAHKEEVVAKKEEEAPEPVVKKEEDPFKGVQVLVKEEVGMEELLELPCFSLEHPFTPKTPSDFPSLGGMDSTKTNNLFCERSKLFPTASILEDQEE